MRIMCSDKLHYNSSDLECCGCELKVSEVAEILGITKNTASNYMVELCNEGFIEKIIPTASPKSRYYAKKK